MPVPQTELGAADPLTPIASDRPNLFGSVALRVRTTPLDSKWRNASRSSLARRAGPWAGTLRAIDSLDRQAQAEAINRWVNARVIFADDGSRDRWSNAATTLSSQRGDCEDVAIAKMKLLEAAGVPRGDLYLVIAYDLVRRADHAVLALRNNGRLMILDNGTDEVRDQAAVPDYRPIVTYSAQGAWVHGFASMASAR